jgi:hypothetical protein
MSIRTLLRSLVFLAVVAAIHGPGVRAEAGRRPPVNGPAVNMLDPGHELRRAVAPGVTAEIASRLRRNVERGIVWTETMFATLAVATAEIHELDRDGRMTDSNRHEIAAMTALLVVDTVVELHPELLPAVGASLSRVAATASPIERICQCDKSGSRACGCRVIETGPGSCEYRVMCPSVLNALCSAVNVEMCVAETVTGILTATM